ncbi:PREDICTED: uncharacterized protein LOC109231621 [Nicotiana attenuata]|uniref:uncharacterized protein LOC109231621 n=1 Tax=Nicotiana attenuata TaxID=49451 RepID=UPI0009059819|nr:PREDICTED: uncharacterized protein LOC109231621 [Nicotiana attenuata]
MDRFVTRTNVGQPSSSSTNPSIASFIAPEIQRDTFLSDLDLESLNADLGDRKPITEYSPNIRDEGQHSTWLEYNISKDAAYCLCWYLFKNEHESHGNTGYAFTKNGLLLGMASLNPVNSFGSFDKKRIMRLAEYYPNEFDSSKLRDLSCQLDSFIVYARGLTRASVEQAFSSMNYIKSELCNSIGDVFLNSCLVCYVERKIFSSVSNDAIIHRFQHIKSR